jgi:hypothetical protein
MRRAGPFVIALLVLPRAAGAQGNPIGPEFRVNTNTAGSQLNPSMAADSSGRFVVVWLDGSTGLDISGQRYDSSGLPAGPEFRVNTYTTGAQYDPEVASDAAGNFVVVWTSYGQDGSQHGVFGQRFTSSGAPLGSEFRVNSATTDVQYTPSVASLGGTGDFVILWSGESDGGIREPEVFGRRFAGSGAPLGPEFRVNTFTFNGQVGPAAAADAAGNFVVMWSSNYQASPNGPTVYGQRFSSTGVPLGPEFRVSTFTNFTSGGPSVAMRPSGEFVATWTSLFEDGSGTGVFGQRFASSGAPVGAEFRVNTHTTGNQGGSRVALDGSGNFVVVWSSAGQDGSGTGVFGQRHEGSGVPLGPEFRVNTYTTDDQGGPAVAADPLGNFVVAWHSEQDGSGFGIFGQRYAPIFPVELTAFTVQ